MAAHDGHPSLRALVLPYPLEGRPDDEVRQIAADAYPDSCGPSGCLSDPLVSDRIRIDDDPVALYELSLEAGWGDGLPLLPPTERRVRGMLAATPFHADDVVGILPPMNREATVEMVAINAAMAGCERGACRT